MANGTTLLKSTSFGSCPQTNNTDADIPVEAKVNSSDHILVALVPRYAPHLQRTVHSLRQHTVNTVLYTVVGSAACQIRQTERAVAAVECDTRVDRLLRCGFKAEHRFTSAYKFFNALAYAVSSD